MRLLLFRPLRRLYLVVPSFKPVYFFLLCARESLALREIRLDWVGSCAADLRMDECHGERDLVDWPPVISLAQDGHEGSSVGSDRNFSSSQTKKAAKGAKKQIARQTKNRKRREKQKIRKRESSQIQHGPARDNTGGGVPTNYPLGLSGRTLFSLRRNLKKQKDRMVTHLCPDFDVEDTIRNIRKAQPGGNKDPDFETFNEPTLELVKGEIVTLTDRFVVPMIYLVGCPRADYSY